MEGAAFCLILGLGACADGLAEVSGGMAVLVGGVAVVIWAKRRRKRGGARVRRGVDVPAET